MLRRRSASREPQPPNPDAQRPLLSPLFTHFSSPETHYTQSPGSIEHGSRTRLKHRDHAADEVPMGEESEEEDQAGEGHHDLGRLARGIEGVGKLFDTHRRNSDFLKHANTSLHSLLSRHGTLLEHDTGDSGPPTGSSGYPTGHILAPRSASSTDLTDLDALKPPRNADDEYLVRSRRLFMDPVEQARVNEKIIGGMRGWMDELLGMQEGIAELHMRLEGVEVDGGAETMDDGKHDRGNDDQEQREDKIMDEMIDKLHQLFGKLQEFHATPHPTIAFPSSRTGASVANTVPGTPRISEEDERKQVGSSWLSRERGSSRGENVPLPLPAEGKDPATASVAEKVRDASVKSPMDPEHPRQFLRPKQYRDFAKDPQPTTPEQNTRGNSSLANGDRKEPSTNDRRIPSRPHPIVTKPNVGHNADHVDLRRRVLQSQDRRRVESVESLVGGEEAAGAAGRDGVVSGRPGATRTWSTVLGG